MKQKTKKLEQGFSYNKLGFIHYSHGDHTLEKQLNLPKGLIAHNVFRYQLTSEDGQKSLLEMSYN
ncbi:MAG: hypothetical protein ACYSU3_24525 [Planctomycetota bacterium]|jgi:hypothetical protein